MALKDKLKEKRIENGLTLEEAAKKLGVSKPTLHRYESGVISNIPSDKIEGLAEIYKTTPAYLMGWEDEKGNSLIGLAEIIIAKHRNGATADVLLRFKSEFARFQNVEDEYNADGAQFMSKMSATPSAESFPPMSGNDVVPF